MRDDFNTINDLKAHSDTGEETCGKSITDRQDETNEKLDDVKSDVQSVKEGVEGIKELLGKESAADVANEKQQINNNTVEANGTISGNQNIVHNTYIYGNSTFDIKEVTDRSVISGNTEIKEYDLTNAKEFAEFGEKFKASEQFAFAIMLCVFEYVELDDWQNLKSMLMDELPKMIDEEGKEIAVYQNPYLPINNVLRTVKGKLFTTVMGDKCVGLGKARSLAIENLWEQFPSMRECISRWLLNVSDAFEYRKNFDTYQVVTAFVNIMKLDFHAGIRHIFPRLYSNSNKAWLLGAIALALYNDEDYREKIFPIIINWISSSSSWLWKPACYVYSYTKAEVKNREFDIEMNNVFKHRLESFNISDLQYIIRIFIYSERMRTLLAHTLNELLAKRKIYDEKLNLAAIYLLCVRRGYFEVTNEYPECPLIACDTKNQLLNIQAVTTIVLQKYDSRRTLFSVLEAYLQEISNYNVADKVINHIKAYFMLMIKNNPRYIKDIQMLLQRCNCSIATEVLIILKVK